MDSTMTQVFQIRPQQFALPLPPVPPATEHIYIGANGVEKIRTDGISVWSYPSSNSSRVTTVAVDPDGFVYFGNFDSPFKVYKLNPDGTLAWESAVTFANRVVNVAVDNTGSVYAGSWDGTLKKINGITGGTVWSHTGSSTGRVPLVAIDSSNNVFCYIQSTSGPTVRAVRRVNSSTGGTIWQENFGSSLISTLTIRPNSQQVWATVADNQMSIRSTITGGLIGSQTAPTHNGFAFNRALTFDESNIHFMSSSFVNDFRVMRRAAPTGTDLLWARDFDAVVNSVAVDNDNFVYGITNTSNGEAIIRKMHPDDGTTVWELVRSTAQRAIATDPGLPGAGFIFAS